MDYRIQRHTAHASAARLRRGDNVRCGRGDIGTQRRRLASVQHGPIRAREEARTSQASMALRGRRRLQAASALARREARAPGGAWARPHGSAAAGGGTHHEEDEESIRHRRMGCKGKDWELVLGARLPALVEKVAPSRGMPPTRCHPPRQTRGLPRRCQINQPRPVGSLDRRRVAVGTREQQQ